MEIEKIIRMLAVFIVVAMALAAYVAEDGLVGHQWEERTLVL